MASDRRRSCSRGYDEARILNTGGPRPSYVGSLSERGLTGWNRPRADGCGRAVRFPSRVRAEPQALLGPGQELVEERSCLALGPGHQMPVEVECQLDRRVAHVLRERLGVDPGADHEGGIRVPCLVQT